MTATVAEFTTVPNHFADTDDEVIIYSDVMLVDADTEVGAAWSSHSATLKKLALEIGDKLTFEAKIAAKKLTKRDPAGNLLQAGMALDMGGQDHHWLREVLIRQMGGQPLNPCFAEQVTVLAVRSDGWIAVTDEDGGRWTINSSRIYAVKVDRPDRVAQR